MSNYLGRIVDEQLERYLRISGAVHLRGPRACGKTMTARRQARSEARLDIDSAMLNVATTAPGRLLEGPTPRLIDEWQAAPGIWNHIRHEVDDRQAKGQFILTGSASPDEDSARHSGAGRIIGIEMRTLTVREQMPTADVVSLRTLFAGGELGGETDLLVPDYVDLMVRGGWPGLLGLDTADAQEMNSSYIDEMVEHDFPEVGGRRRDPRLFRAFLAAYAGLVAQPSQLAAVRKRMGEVIDRAPAPDTIAQLHDFAARLYLVEDQPAWSPKLRSRKPLIQSAKRHLCDVSLACSLLGANSGRVLADVETLGFLFESLVVHDIRVYAQAIGARGVFHYRDSKGRDEIDVIVEDADGGWIGCEVKTSHQHIDSAAHNLLRVSADIERAPAALVVVIPTGPAYRRPDGVFVIPHALLGP